MVGTQIIQKSLQEKQSSTKTYIVLSNEWIMYDSTYTCTCMYSFLNLQLWNYLNVQDYILNIMNLNMINGTYLILWPENFVSDQVGSNFPYKQILAHFGNLSKHTKINFVQYLHLVEVHSALFSIWHK